MIEYAFVMWSQIIFLTLVVFAVSSGFLYSDGPKELRDWYFEKTNSSKYWIVRKLSYLAMCQLCCGFWFAMALQWMILDWINIIAYIMVSLTVAGIVWTLGGLTRFLLWGAAFFQQNME